MQAAEPLFANTNFSATRPLCEASSVVQHGKATCLRKLKGFLVRLVETKRHDTAGLLGDISVPFSNVDPHSVTVDKSILRYPCYLS